MAIKKGEILEGTVEKVSFPNKGIVPVEGKTVVVKNTIPGQQIRFRINKKKNGMAEGQLLEVLEKSPEETADPGCRIYPACGGCLYRSLPYDRQLALKEAGIRELMAKYLLDKDIFEGIKPSPDVVGYRNKMEFSFGDSEKNGPLTLGLHKKGSTYDILNASGCQIVHEDFSRILDCVLDFCRSKGWKYYHKLSHEGYLRHLLIRRAASTGEILVDLVTSSQYKASIEEGEESWQETGCERKNAVCTDEAQNLADLASRILALPLEGRIKGILHTVNDSVADTVQNDHTDILWGEDHFYEKLLGLTFKITPFSFFQTNSRGAEVLYETAREYLGCIDDQTVFDLYSGTGTIAQMMAPVVRKVIGVEIVEEAVEAARENAQLNGLDNCEFIAGDVLKVIDSIEEKPDTIVLDPPRDGIHPKALPKILEFGVDRIVYISCKPSSLARDLETFLLGGYQLERMCCVDMFPATVHVETVVLLSRESK